MSPAVDQLEERVGALLAAQQTMAAAELIVRELGPDVLGYLAAVLRDDELAREALGTLSEQLLHGVSGYRGEGSLRGWTYRIAWRTALKLRQEPHRRHEQRLDTDLASRLGVAHTSRPAYLRSAAQGWLERMRAALSPEDQSLLTLRVDRDLSWEEVASVMGEPDERGAAARLRKRFERLKARLKEEATRDGLLE